MQLSANKRRCRANVDTKVGQCMGKMAALRAMRKNLDYNKQRLLDGKELTEHEMDRSARVHGRADELGWPCVDIAVVLRPLENAAACKRYRQRINQNLGRQKRRAQERQAAISMSEVESSEVESSDEESSDEESGAESSDREISEVLRALCSKKSARMLLETDPHRLRQRQKQIDCGKNTIGYKNCIQSISR
jgi:hypothetical protein